MFCGLFMTCSIREKLTGVAVQFTQDQKNATDCIAIFNIKIWCYVLLFIPTSSKVEFFAIQINVESKLFPVINTTLNMLNFKLSNKLKDLYLSSCTC